MRPLPEDQVEHKKVSLTERIARVGVIMMISALFVGISIYGFLECEKYYQPYNDVRAEGGKD